MINIAVFTLLQIPTALVSNAAGFIVLRTLTGLFASVGVANGGGVISDLFPTSERASVLGFYLLGPLLGPSLGPLLGGIIISKTDWRWIFWAVFIIASVLTVVSYFLLQESFPVIILSKRKQELQQQNPDKRYRVDGGSDQPVLSKIAAVCRCNYRCHALTGL